MLLLVSAWFVDMFIMTARVFLYLKRRFAGEPATGEEGRKKFSLPPLAFPLMWLFVFVVLVAVSSVQGTRDPVTRRVEVGGWIIGRFFLYVFALFCPMRRYLE